VDLPYVSILLPVRGEQEDLVACLESLAAQTYPRDRFEVLIADASDTPIQAGIIPAGVNASIIPNPERLMSRGLNLVAGQARGDYLAIVSAHSWLPPDYLEQMAATAAATGAANVGTRILKVARTDWGRAIAAATTSPLGVGGSIQHHGSAAGEADSAFPGFIERAAFERVGGFNPDLACNEDDEFNARVRASGRAIWFEPAVEVAYRPRETLTGAFRQYFRYGRWKVAVARTGVPGYLRLRHAVPALALGAGLALSMATLWRRVLGIPLAAAGIAYLALALAEGRRLAPAHGARPWRAAMAFPFIHAGYGLGFMRGLLDRGMPREGGAADAATESRPASVPDAPIEYRALTLADVAGAARLHREVFADYFLGHMGQRFLELFYAEFAGRPGNYGFVALSGEHVVGVVVGSSDLGTFFPDFYRRHFIELAVRVLVQLVRDDYVRAHVAARIPHVAMAVRSRLGSGAGAAAPDPDAWPPAQLLSIGVAAPYRGLGIAEALTERFCAGLAADGVDAVGLSVLNGNARAISFYGKSGWRLRTADDTSMTFWRPLGENASKDPPAPVR
jgi:succinoglycan biosynthesis protein ExoA